MLENINIDYIQSNIEISISIIKTIFFILCTYYTNFKILNKKITLNIELLCKTCFLVAMVLISGIIRYNANFATRLVSLVLAISLLFSTNNITISTITTIISLAINYLILISAIIINFVFDIITQLNNDYINVVIILFFHALILQRFWKLRKFKYGISRLQKERKINHIDLLILNISTIILFTIIILANSNIIVARDIGPSLIIIATIMFITIHKSLQLYYKQKLFEKELKETKAKLQEKENEVKELEAENLKISKNSHTLAHKQKSLEHKIEQMMTKAEISTEEAAEVRDRVKEIEKDLYKEKSTIKLDKTGIVQIDDMLEYMQSECKKNKIDFELQIKGNIYYMTNNLISKEDLETLLADHIKNAIIAINHTDNVNRSILVRLGEIDGTYSLYIYDSGIEFEKETLENLGKKPSTTHANEGGTGMGFMNTFDTLRKCEASLIINELNEPSKENYTKAIIIKFDKKNEFKIISYR